MRRCVLLEGLFRTRSSIVSGTESLMSLHRMRPSAARGVRESSQSIFQHLFTSSLIKKLHSISWDGQSISNIGVACQDLNGHVIVGQLCAYPCQ